MNIHRHATWFGWAQNSALLDSAWIQAWLSSFTYGNILDAARLGSARHDFIRGSARAVGWFKKVFIDGRVRVKISTVRLFWSPNAIEAHVEHGKSMMSPNFLHPDLVRAD